MNWGMQNRNLLRRPLQPPSPRSATMLKRLCHAGVSLFNLRKRGSPMGMTKISYTGYRFPPEIIHQAIWLYLRFTLSLRDVEDLLAERTPNGREQLRNRNADARGRRRHATLGLRDIRTSPQQIDREKRPIRRPRWKAGVVTTRSFRWPVPFQGLLVQ